MTKMRKVFAQFLLPLKQNTIIVSGTGAVVKITDSHFCLKGSIPGKKTALFSYVFLG